MATESKLKEDIKKLETAINGKAPEKLKAKFKNQLAILKTELSALQKPAASKMSRAKQLRAKYKALYGFRFQGIDIEKDADIPAMRIGRRVSQGIKGNQYASKKQAKGNVYYEYRENRIDIKQPPKKYPKLEDGGMMADGGVIDSDVFDKLKKGDNIHIIYPRGQNFVEKELVVKSKNLVGKGKSYESEKITFTDVSNPNGVNFFAYKRKSGFVGFAQGDSAMPYVQIKEKMAKGGKTQGYDDREDERLAMKYGKIKSKYLDSTKARRDDARFEERMDDGGMMAKGGELDAQLSNIKGNILGTMSFDLKINGMRKPQDFIVYPVSSNESGKYITIQSDTRIGKINLMDGKGMMSQSHSNGAYFYHLSMDKKTPFVLSESDLKELNSKILGSRGKEVGKSVIISDNSNAGMMDDGGYMAKGGDVEDIKNKIYDSFKEWLGNYISDEELVNSLKRKLGTKYFRFFKGDTLVSDWRSVENSLKSKNNRDFLKENIEISLEEKSLEIYNSKNEKLEQGGMMAKGGAVTKEYRISPMIPTGVKGMITTDYQKMERFSGTEDEAVARAKEMASSNPNFVRVEVKLPLKTKVNTVAIIDGQNKQYADGGMMAKGGEVNGDNMEMVVSQIKAIKHHAEELSKIVTPSTPIEAWVVAKIERSETDLSDVTHYLDGLKMENGGRVSSSQHRLNR